MRLATVREAQELSLLCLWRDKYYLSCRLRIDLFAGVHTTASTSREDNRSNRLEAAT